MSVYQDKIDRLAKLCELICDSKSAGEFAINCILNGQVDTATKQFFDENLFPFLFGDEAVDRKLLKYVIPLRKQIQKLNEIYSSLR